MGAEGLFSPAEAMSAGSHDPPNPPRGAQAPLLEFGASRAAAFESLCEEAAACGKCPRMAGRTSVLGRANGSLRPVILFAAEAPGRRGADRTRVPMSGDASGRTFRALLAESGIGGFPHFITNAVLCNPRTETGANRPPSSSEVRNCSTYLRRTIDLLNPPVIASVGARALAALGSISPHGLALGQSAARMFTWHGRLLVPLYHPSPQALISRRSFAEQLEDWKTVAEELARRGYSRGE